MLTTMMVSALDFPHEPSNPILPGLSCLNCHDLDSMEAKLLKPSTPHPEMDGDDTNPNNLCWSCHTGPQLAPYRVPHSSQQTGNQFGEWFIECRTCHWPHSQLQFKVYGEQSYLASGTLTQATSGPMFSTLTDAAANWQVDEHAGRVIYPNLNAQNPVNPGTPLDNLSYRVLSNTATTLTLDGRIDLTRIAPGDSYAIIYGKLIKDAIKVPGSGEPGTWKKVKFFRNSGANSYADSDSTLDGVCQVCHTKTGHFRNDGSGDDQMHCNANRGNPNGTAGETCTAKCHKHIGGFGHGKGYTRVDLCVECHGHEEGTYYMIDGQYPYNPDDPSRLSQVPSRGFGSTTAHSTHTESWINSGNGWGETTPASAGADDRRGPGIYCNSCHDIDNMPTFKSGVDRNEDGLFTLDETDVCDACHSPEGSYNGVNTVGNSVGAKDNWRSNGVYSADNATLKPGKEKWCAGCHDERHGAEQHSSHINTAAWDTAAGIERSVDVVAPPVIGDEDDPYNYGTGWGFYKTGHGLPTDQSIPSSGGSKPGPGRECNDCHDPRLPHIDGNQRSFDCADGCDPTEYQNSYRLKYPMQVPLTDGHTTPPIKESNYQLCFSCHDFEAITDTADEGNGPQTSNYYDNILTPRKNLHYWHLGRGVINVSSDWSGDWNSELTCIVCHNPHGTSNFAMIRTGRILEVDADASPALKKGLSVWYGNSNITSRPGGRTPPDPANLTLSASDRSYFWGNVVEEGYCAEACHSGTIYEITRTPVQNTDQTPMLEWAGSTGFEADGVSPDAAASGTNMTFRVKYRDWDNDAPGGIYVWVDIDNDGLFEVETERFVMDEVAGQTVPYSVGRDYSKRIILSRVGDGLIKYYFAAQDADGSATGPATVINSVHVMNAVPQLAWVGDSGYERDGIHPDTGGDGSSFTFRVSYSDRDGTPPDTLLLLEDLNRDGVADAHYAMTPMADGDYATGKTYTYSKTISYAATSAGAAQYAFSASDGMDAATGDPTRWSHFSLLPGNNTPAVLEWVTDAADCRIDSAKPNITLQSEPTGFRLKYTDVDDGGSGPLSVTLQVDLNGNGSYDGAAESIAMTRITAGSDSDWRNGELYEATGVTPTASGTLKYRFAALDADADAAIGEPVSSDRYLTIYDSSTTTAVRTSPAASDPWYNDLQSAIDAIDGAHTVLVMPGTYSQDLQIRNAADSNTTLKSVCGADLTVLKAASSATDAILLQGLSGTTLIDGFQITASRRGIYSNSGGTIEIRNSKIHNNDFSAGDGGGIYIGVNSTLLISDSELYSNTANRGAAVMLNGGLSHAFINTAFSNNASNGAGGALYVQNITNPLTLTNITLTDNTTGGAGGAMATNSITVNASKCTISGNQAGGEGGALYLSGESTFENCVITDNRAVGRGGGISLNNGPTVMLKNSTIANNSSATTGGAIFSNSGALTISNSIVWNNSSGNASGHAVYSNGGSLTIVDAVLQNDGDADLFDEPVLAPARYPAIASGYISDNDPNFVDAAGGDYRIQPLSDAIDNAGSNALNDDRNGVLRTVADIGAYEYPGVGSALPRLSWTGESGFASDGVLPNRATGGSTFELRIDYHNADNIEPSVMEVWIDADADGAFEEGEKHAMTKLTGSTGTFDDGDFSNGERYRYTTPLYHVGDGVVNYRFFSVAGINAATGEPTAIQQLVVDNGVPLLAWPGDQDFADDGVHPDKGAAGGSFIFRVKYQDADNDAPKVAQVWIDTNDDYIYSDTEKYNLSEEGTSHNYRVGEIFTSSPIVLYSTGDERLRYRFYFTDGESVATGEPTDVNKAKERYSRYVIASTVSTLSWTGEPNYISDGVYPDSATGSADFEFRVTYITPLNSPPSQIQLWVDANDNGIYEADEKHDMLESNQSDDNYIDGKIYSRVLSLSAVGDENINYRFFASNSATEAAGAPVADNVLNINFTQTVSGTVYIDSGITPIADGAVIRLVHNGMLAGSDVTTNGTYAISAVYSPGDSLIACIEGNPFNGSSTIVSTGEDITDLDIYGDFGSISWECLQYVTYKPLDNSTNITTARAVVAPGADDAIDISMGYTGDADMNNSYTVRYCMQSACGSWIDYQVDAAHTASPYVTTITGLTAGETYKVQLLYSDDEVNGVNPIEISNITLPYNATTAGVATASARSVDSLFITMPYTNDTNASNNYVIEYKPSNISVWNRWMPELQPHALSPFSAAITDLSVGGMYDVRMTYNDADGFIGGEPSTQIISNIELVNNGTIALEAPASHGAAGTIDISMPYLYDVNADNTYSIEYKLSDAEDWIVWGLNRYPHVSSPFIVTITGLEGGKTYDVRMTFHDDNGFIDGSPKQTVTVYMPYGDQVVCQTGCSGIGPYHGTIQAAIDAAVDGDVVVVLPGTYPEYLTLGINTADRVNIMLKSRDGAGSVRVTGTGALDKPVIDIQGGNTSTLQGFTISNARNDRTQDRSRGIYISAASPTIEDSIIEDNQLIYWSSGAGVYIASGNPLFKRSQIRANYTRWGPGIYCLSGTVTLINAIVSGNGLAGTYTEGAGIYVKDACAATVINSTFSGNWAWKGAAIRGPGSVTAKYSIFWGNHADYTVMDAGYDVTYSVIEGDYAGIGNMPYDPKFVTEVDPTTAPTTAGNFHLQGYSFTPDGILDLVLQGADTMDVLTPNDDYDGEVRPSGSGYSMGAYEWLVQ